MDKKGLRARFIFILCFLAVFTIVFVARLFSLQIVHGDEYKEKAENRLVRAYPIKAPRGEMLDRFGRPMVTNKMGYYIQIQNVNSSNKELNATILHLIEICENGGIEYIDEFPVTALPYKFDFANFEKPEEALKEWKKENKLEKLDSADAVMDFYIEKFDVSEEYSKEDIRNIVAVRYTMTAKNFSVMNPYTFASDIGIDIVQKIKEKSFELGGVNVEIEPVREYVNGSMAAHILGRTGIIYKEEYDELKDKGYGMNDIIGKDGLEKVLESYLKGKDGYKRVEQTKSG